MAEYIDAELLMQKLSRMIDYCEKNKDKKFNALNVLFQVGDAIMDCPTADVVPKSESLPLDVHEALKQRAVEKAKAEVAMEIFEEIERLLREHSDWEILSDGKPLWYYEESLGEDIAELKKKYTGGEPNGN